MSKKSKKFSFINELHTSVLSAAETTRTGTVRIKRAELKKIVETTFDNAVKCAASGERVRFPIIGTLVRKDVKARKSGKGVNKEEIRSVPPRAWRKILECHRNAAPIIFLPHGVM